MRVSTCDYLKILKEEIHSTVFATVDKEGLPATRVIDIMLTDENSLYFITAKGKEFYQQLMEKQFVAISGMTGGEGSLSKKAITIRGKVECIGQELLDQVFIENPYMAEIYPSKESRIALCVFRLHQGNGEYFDLSTRPITRHSFIIGEDSQKLAELRIGYYINESCVACGKCKSVCPQNCIEMSKLPYVIRQENCLHCGNCMSVCNFGAVEKR
ncbi:MAG: 4Fe-4S binding protein [Lachnospiraceae bacterium]